MIIIFNTITDFAWIFDITWIFDSLFFFLLLSLFLLRWTLNEFWFRELFSLTPYKYGIIPLLFAY